MINMTFPYISLLQRISACFWNRFVFFIVASPSHGQEIFEDTLEEMRLPLDVVEEVRQARGEQPIVGCFMMFYISS